MSKEDLISVAECDYLEEDKEIRNQKYVCLSFISPEKVIAEKNVWFFEKFMEDFSLKMNELVNNLKVKYNEESSHLDSLKDSYDFIFKPKLLQDQFKFFLEANNDKLEHDYLEKNNFQTSVRGVKVRGVYDTLKEAQIRSEVLKRLDSKHNIYIGQVGCWLPFDPCPSNIDTQEYGETQLNTLMKKYNENEAAKDIEFEERKREMMSRKTQEYTKETITVEEVKNDVLTMVEVKNEILDEDPWMKAKKEREQEDKQNM